MTKRLIGEFIGTFVIIFSPVAAVSSGANLLIAALVSGLSVMAMVYAVGPVSGAHFNPAVTLAFTSTGHFKARESIPYVLTQFAAGAFAALCCALIFTPGQGAHVPATENLLRNVGTEFSLTFILMFVVIAVATDRRVSPVVPGLSIGLVIVSNVLIGGPVTGASMNPARSFGPALFAGGAAMSHLWLYMIVPTAGAIVAAFVYEVIRPAHSTTEVTSVP